MVSVTYLISRDEKGSTKLSYLLLLPELLFINEFTEEILI